MIIGIGLGTASAQNATEKKDTTKTVIDLSHDGISFKAPAYLKVNVQPLVAAFSKFLIGSENNGEGYVSIRVKDEKGKSVH